MATRRPFWKWHLWKSIGFCLWPPSTCIWNLKLKFQSKLDLCSGNHVVYRQMDGRTDGQTDGQTDGRTRWIQYTPPPTSLGGGIINRINEIAKKTINHIMTRSFMTWNFIKNLSIKLNVTYKMLKYTSFSKCGELYVICSLKHTCVCHQQT